MKDSDYLRDLIELEKIKRANSRPKNPYNECAECGTPTRDLRDDLCYNCRTYPNMEDV